MKRAKYVFQKELREMMRDRRVFVSAIIGPVFLIVLMIFLMGYLQDTLTKPKEITLHVYAGKGSNNFVNQLQKTDKLRIVTYQSKAEGEKLVKDGTIKMLLEFPDNFDGELREHKTATIKAVFDRDEPMAGIPLKVVQETINKLNSETVKALLAQNNIPTELSEPLKLKEAPLPKKEGMGGAMILQLIPYLVVIWAFYGGFSTVTEMVTGEKEKSTLETLLITPVSRTEIALGKFFALGLQCLVSSLMTLVCVVGLGVLNLPITRSLFPNGATPSLMHLVSILAVIVPLVAMFAGILLTICAYAKNTREAQTYLTLISFVVLMPAIFSQFIGYTDMAKAAWVSFVPILNSAMCIRDALSDKLDLGMLGITTGTSIALAALCIAKAVQMFKREEVLTRV